MELLQKLTLYDLLGYTVPGSVLLILWKQDDLQQLLDAGAGGVVLLVVAGFLVGIMMSEIMSWIEKIFGKLFAKKQWEIICKKYVLSEEQITKALRNANIIPEDIGEDREKPYWEYCTAMYADIQADSRYSRIHNYASAALLYRNMVFAAVFCIIVGRNTIIYEEIVLGIVGVLCFGIRWWRFNGKKIGYAVSWFIEKHADNM